MNAACSSRYSDGEQVYECARGTGHEGPHQHYPYTWVSENAMRECEQGLGIGYDPSKSRLQSPDSALDRASIPAMFNVIGDELRKLSEGQECHLSRLADMEENLSRWMDKLNEKVLNRYNCHEIELNAIKHRIERGNEQLTAIGSQLTALRAEADKGRETLGFLVDDLTMHFYSNMCRNGHPQIGYNDSSCLICESRGVIAMNIEDILVDEEFVRDVEGILKRNSWSSVEPIALCKAVVECVKQHRWVEIRARRERKKKQERKREKR